MEISGADKPDSYFAVINPNMRCANIQVREQEFPTHNHPNQTCLIKEGNGKLFPSRLPHLDLTVNRVSTANERFLQTALYFTLSQSIMTAFTCSWQNNHLKVDQTYLSLYKSNIWWRRMLSGRKMSSRAACSALVCTFLFYYDNTAVQQLSFLKAWWKYVMIFWNMRRSCLSLERCFLWCWCKNAWNASKLN